MKLNLTIFLAFVIFSVFVDGKKRCSMECDDVAEPICARRVNPQTFINKCLLEYKECKSKNKFTIVSEGACPTDDSDASTPPDKPAKKYNDNPADTLSGAPTDKPTDKPDEKPTDKPDGKPGDKPGDKPANASTNKPSATAARKIYSNYKLR